MMTTDQISMSLCKELVASEISTRCFIVGFLTKKLLDEYGNKVLDTIKEANYEAGLVSGKQAAQALGKNDLEALARLFGESSGTKVFDPELIELTRDKAIVHWRGCSVPLLIGPFKDRGMPDDYLEFICPILEQFDKGFAEGFNPELTVRTPPEVGEMGLAKGDKYCTVIVMKKPRRQKSK